MKTATCVRTVPAILSPTNKPIEVGEKIEYTKIFFDNGEHHFKLANGNRVPSVFFNWSAK
jgi:hypothetical protein